MYGSQETEAMMDRDSKMYDSDNHDLADSLRVSKLSTGPNSRCQSPSDQLVNSNRVTEGETESETIDDFFIFDPISRQYRITDARELRDVAVTTTEQPTNSETSTVEDEAPVSPLSGYLQDSQLSHSESKHSQVTLMHQDSKKESYTIYINFSDRENSTSNVICDQETDKGTKVNIQSTKACQTTVLPTAKNENSRLSHQEVKDFIPPKASEDSLTKINLVVSLEDQISERISNSIRIDKQLDSATIWSKCSTAVSDFSVDMNIQEAIRQYENLVQQVKNVLEKRVQANKNNQNLVQQRFPLKRFWRILRDLQQIATYLKEFGYPNLDTVDLEDQLPLLNESVERDAKMESTKCLHDTNRLSSCDWSKKLTIKENLQDPKVHVSRIDGNTKAPERLSYSNDYFPVQKEYELSSRPHHCITRLVCRCQTLERELQNCRRDHISPSQNNRGGVWTDSLFEANKSMRQRLNKLQNTQIKRDASIRNARALIEDLIMKQRLQEESMQRKVKMYKFIRIPDRTSQCAEYNEDDSLVTWRLNAPESSNLDYKHKSAHGSSSHKFEPKPQTTFGNWTGRFQDMNQRAISMQKMLEQLKIDYSRLANSVIRMEAKAREAAYSVQKLIARANLSLSHSNEELNTFHASSQLREQSPIDRGHVYQPFGQCLTKSRECYGSLGL